MTLAVLANHLWQSTLFALTVGLLTLALRRNRAAVRYYLWLAASIKFLIPFAVFEALGRNIPWQGAVAAPAVTLAIAQVSQPFTSGFNAMEAAAVSAAAPWLALGLAVLWFGGAGWVAFRWYGRWRQVHAALSAASRLPVEAPVPVLSSATRLEPGIFGILRPVLLLPEGIAERLPPAQLQAILAHEFCHVRRRDHRTAAVHMLVETLCWFHPIVWWIGARLVEERERACDEEVLGQGSPPEVYAAGILNVCRFYLESPLPCAPGVTGANLRKRIEAIMTKRTQVPLTLTRKLLLTGATLAAIGAPIGIGIATATASRAQETDATLRFDVASIKPAKNAGGRGGMIILPGGGLRMDGVTVLNLIAFAYDVHEGQITGAPKWVGDQAVNVLAKPEHPTAADDAAPTSGPGNSAWDRVRARTRNLLIERFHLEV
ncbi:MAG: M56 family metallopeptidase, partial [Candidatus Solibacter sp.]